MAQVIRNIKAGQLFEVIGRKSSGFQVGSIIKANESTINIKDKYKFVGQFSWIGGSGEIYKDITLAQKTIDLKRHKGKIK